MTALGRRMATLLAPPLFAAWTGVAHAQAPTPPAQYARRQATFAWDKALLRTSFSFRDVVDTDIQKKLQSGLRTTIVMRAYVYRESGGDPIAGTARTCRVVFDLWDEVYQIAVEQPGAGETATTVLSVEGVLRTCAEARGLPIATRPLLRAGEPHFVASLVEVNPVSQEMLDRIKKWVSRPAGTQPVTPGDALFGSFVGLFAARIGDADRKAQFRTQTFVP